jgi:hypothetical protein
MSWRFLIAILIVAAGASAWGGVQLGNWMISHAPPASSNATVNQGGDDSDMPTLDANGRPYTAQPPQPLVNGTLGVPDKPPVQDWSTRPPSLFDGADPNAQISRDSVNQAQAQAAADANNAGLPTGASDVVTLDDSKQVAPPANGPLPPVTSGNFNHAPLTAQSGYPSAPAPQQASNWKTALHSEVERCSDLGFFQRPTCVWNARNKYCAPNNAWGTVADCPSRQQGN